MNKIRLQLVEYMPTELEAGILYVSEEFETAAHLCACGCGTKIRTPLGPTEWKFTETIDGPSLYPSIGNWQLPCRSHYVVFRGEIQWARDWTNEQVLAGQLREQARRNYYFESLYRNEPGLLSRIWSWVKSLVN